MKRFSIVVCIAITIAAALYLIVTVPALPDNVATKFYGGERVGSVMSRATYLWVMLALTVGLPAFIVMALGWLPAWTERGTNLPNRSYWFAPERRAQTLDYLRTQAGWIGSLTVGFLCATHAFILQAHAHVPPRPQIWPYSVIIVLFVLATLGWSLLLYLRFRRVPH